MGRDLQIDIRPQAVKQFLCFRHHAPGLRGPQLHVELFAPAQAAQLLQMRKIINTAFLFQDRGIGGNPLQRVNPHCLFDPVQVSRVQIPFHFASPL